MLNYAYWAVGGRLFGKLLHSSAPSGPAWLKKLFSKLVPAPETNHRAQVRRIIRVGPLAITVLTLVAAATLMVGAAINEADAIKQGTAPRANFGLFHAEHVSASWIANGTGHKLPGCRDLYYLGEGGERIALFDTRNETTLRIDSDELRLAFPEDC